jgi:putative NADH-flavin reductase
MRITIIGASAGIGQETVKQALARGHQVTTLSRSPIPPQPALTSITGTATAVEDVKKATANADAVIITIGIDKVATLFTEAASALMQADVYVPVIIVTGFGAGDSRTYGNWFYRLITGTLLKKEYENKTAMEQLIAGSKLKWVFVRPGMLTNQPFAQYQILPALTKGMKVKSIPRASVADFLLNQAEQPTLLYHYVSLTK